MITARWVEQGPQRHTPAGLPALDLTLAHQGTTLEAGSPRRVELQMRAVVLGALAEQARRMAAETLADWHGFLAPARNGRGLVLHVTQIEPCA